MFQLCEGRFCARGIRNRDEVMRRNQVLLMTAKDFPQTPPETVPNDGVPDTAGSDKTSAKLVTVDFQAAKGYEGSPNEFPFPANPLKVGPLEEPPGPWEPL